MTTEKTLTEEVQSVFEQAGLEPEASVKLSSLFEASVTAKVNQIKESIVTEAEAAKVALVEANEKQLQEKADAVKAELSEQIGAYLDVFAEEWMEANKVAVESAIRVEVAENFIGQMLTVFKENYVDLPEEKYDLVTASKTEAEALTAKLNESIQTNLELKKSLVEQSKAIVFASVTKDLTDTEVEKLTGLVEGIDYENDDVYSEKLKMIKETYITKGETRKSYSLDFIDEDVVNTPVVDDSVKLMIEGLDRLAPR